MQTLGAASSWRATMASITVCGLDWMAKSRKVVTPPIAAARLPVRKSSALTVPQNGSWKWLCTSMAPGITILPLASMISAPSRSSPSAAMYSPRMPTSARVSPWEEATWPPLMTMS